MTQEKHLVNPQIIGVPNEAQQARIDAGEFLTNLWQGEMQQIPVNMRGNPVGFANGLALAIPGVRRFRMAFNTYSFNDDGSFHPEMEAFLAQMWANGYDALWVLMDGPSQESGNSDSLIRQWPDIYRTMAGLQDWIDLMPVLSARQEESWMKLLAWLRSHPEARTGGFEAINEPASYGRAAARFPASADFFVKAYVDHVSRIHDIVSEEHPDIDFFVGGWNYSATFDVLNDTEVEGGVSAIQHLKDKVGEKLIWSVHLYPQWGINAQTLGALNTWLDKRFSTILGDRIVFTEFNIQNTQANSWALKSEDQRSTFMFARNGEWFSRRKVGIGYWPVVNYASGYMIFISGAGRLRQRHQNSYGCGLGLFATGNNEQMFEGLPVSGYSPVTKIPLDEVPYITSSDWRNPSESPTARSFAYCFGGAGVCVLRGDNESNNFLVGGNGRNIFYGGDLDDQIYTGLGGGVVRTSTGNNVVTINGGSSRVYTGSGYTLVSLYRGATELVIDPTGHHIIFGFNPSKGDRVSFMGHFSDWEGLRLSSLTESADTNIPSEVNLVVQTEAGGSVIFQNCAHLIDSLRSFCLDLTDGWYAPGWVEPTDYTESQFDDPIIEPEDPESESSYWSPRYSDGTIAHTYLSGGVEIFRNDL